MALYGARLRWISNIHVRRDADASRGLDQRALFRLACPAHPYGTRAERRQLGGGGEQSGNNQPRRHTLAAHRSGRRERLAFEGAVPDSPPARWPPPPFETRSSRLAATQRASPGFRVASRGSTWPSRLGWTSASCSCRAASTARSGPRGGTYTFAGRIGC